VSVCVFLLYLSFLIPLCSLHDVATAQAAPWFPAYMECLLDPAWPIPGFSQWWSRRLKSWLKEIEPANFWTFHRPVAGTSDSAIQQTSYGFSSRFFHVLTACSCRYEDCLLLFRTADMDCLDTVQAADATHFLYWPMVLLPIIIGPHLSNGECDRARV
jgi:hypothetical protein